MSNRIRVALVSGLLTLGYVALQSHIPVWSQSQATSEASSEATSEATSEASSEASVESGLVYGPTGYQVYQTWPRPYMWPIPSNGYQTYQPWPPGYMLPLAANGWPAASSVDPSWVYWESTQPVPSPIMAPPTPAVPTTAPAPVIPPAGPAQHGYARVIPHNVQNWSDGMLQPNYGYFGDTMQQGINAVPLPMRPVRTYGFMRVYKHHPAAALHHRAHHLVRHANRR